MGASFLPIPGLDVIPNELASKYIKSKVQASACFGIRKVCRLLNETPFD